MEAKIHKDVVLFKRILTHDKFDDHVEEVLFDPQDLAASKLFLSGLVTIELTCRSIS